MLNDSIVHDVFPKLQPDAPTWRSQWQSIRVHVISSTLCVIVAELTDCCDDGSGEEQSAGELPLRSEAIRHELDDVGGDLLVPGSVDVVRLPQPPRLFLQLPTLRHLVLGLQRVENGGTDQQVSESTDDQCQGSDVLSLHRKPTTHNRPLQLFSDVPATSLLSLLTKMLVQHLRLFTANRADQSSVE